MLITEAGVRPRATDPVYLMLRPEPQAARQLCDLVRRLCANRQLAAQPIEENRLHATIFRLCSYGRISPNTLAAIDELLTTVAMPPFLFGLDWLTNFGSEDNPALVLRGGEGVIGMTMLQDELAVTMRRIGLFGKRSTPHVTLAYARRKITERMVEEVCWTVREFGLICSLEGRHRHLMLGRWPLRG